MSSLLPAPLPPQLGPYVVGAKIGGGGMATVYLGRHPDDTAQGLKLVALKVIRDDLIADEAYRAMFDDEARILSRLVHPGIIRHVGYGHSASHAYIAMELVLGRSLMDIWQTCDADGTPMPIDLGAFVTMQIAEALHHAHTLVDGDGQRTGVIHRDVNPSNIFITYDGRVKLIDFGLAKARGRRHESGRGIVKGKVGYFAPEQITQATLDHRTDVYALGATLWEVTTAKRLFKRATDVETIRAIQAHDVPDPRTIVDGWYPESLWKIISCALESDRENRYSTAAAMADDLRGFLGKHGRKGDMQTALATWVEQLFPGEHAAQSEWLIDAVENALPRATMMPPAPLADVPELSLTAPTKLPPMPRTGFEPPEVKPVSAAAEPPAEAPGLAVGWMIAGALLVLAAMVAGAAALTH